MRLIIRCILILPLWFRKIRAGLKNRIVTSEEKERIRDSCVLRNFVLIIRMKAKRVWEPDRMVVSMKQRRIGLCLCMLSAVFLLAGTETYAAEKNDSGDDISWEDLSLEHSMELLYAEQFSVDYYEAPEENGDVDAELETADEAGESAEDTEAADELYKLITIQEAGRFLVVPEGAEVPTGLEEDITVLQAPIQNIYLVATSAMDLFCAVDGLDAIALSGTDTDGWYVKPAKEAMENGSIVYAGKYSAPDYELILSKDCGLAIESTMIYHTPEVWEKLEGLGIPVLVERSSYEPHPLGRTEWMKLYGALLGEEQQAEEEFQKQADQLARIESEEGTGKTVAFFYISSNGYANVRKTNDYVAKMIELAGGTYIFNDLDDDENSLSTMNMDMEEFYARAKDADYIIYNSTIDGELTTIEELLAKSALLGDFKAVQDGNVWCTGKNLFQETTGLGDMIADIHEMITSEDASLDELTYLHRLK